MKEVRNLCNESISEDVIDLPERGYTVWDNVLGCYHGCKIHGDRVAFSGWNQFFRCGQNERYRWC